MKRAARTLLIGYLSLFTAFSRYPQRAIQERDLLVGSMEYAYAHYRAGGFGRIGALLRAMWVHLGELHPLALAAKYRADDVCARNNGEAGAPGSLIVRAGLAGTVVILLVGWAPQAAAWLLLAAGAFLVLAAARRTRSLALVLLLTLLVWPFVEPRVAAEVRYGSVAAAVVAVVVIAAIAVGWHLVAARLRPSLPWRVVVLVAALPLGWLLISVAGDQITALLVLPDAPADGPGRLMLTPGEASALIRSLSIALYWALVAWFASNAGAPDAEVARG